jgi:hypothetical protein
VPKHQVEEYERARRLLLAWMHKTTVSIGVGRDRQCRKYRLMVDTGPVYSREEILVLFDRLLELLSKPGALRPPSLNLYWDTLLEESKERGECVS